MSVGTASDGIRRSGIDVQNVAIAKIGLLKSSQEGRRRPNMYEKCTFWITTTKEGGICNSDYGRGLKCDGLNPPKGCPYNRNKEAK